MIALLVFLKAWILANQIGIAAVLGWAALEWGLPRVKFLRANSTVELLANLAKRILLDRVPLVGRVVKVLATPTGDEEPKAKILPGEISKFAFLPILFAASVLVSGCATPAGRAFKACELGKLPAEGQTAWATVQDIVSNPSSSKEDLIAAGLSMLPGQLDCAAKALLAWLDGLKEPAGSDGMPVRQALLGAWHESAHDHARAVLREYLAGKSTSCRPTKVASASPVDCDDGHACRQVVVDDDVPASVR